MAKQFFVMLSSSVLARLSFLLALPVLARHFAPDQIGQWQLYASFGLMIASLVSFRYELAVVIPRREKDAARVFGACLYATVVMSLLLAGVVAFGAKPIAAVMGVPDLWRYFWITPLLTFAFGVEQAGSYWLTRCQAFNDLAPIRIVKSLVTVGVPLACIAWTDVGVEHLILGTVAGQLMATAALVVTLVTRRPVPAKQWLRPRAAWLAAIRYKNYPWYVAPYSFVGQLGKRAVLVLLAAFATPHAVGLFAIAMQLTYVPLTFVANTLNQVFYPQIARRIGDPDLGPFVSRMLTRLACFGAPALTCVAFQAGPLIELTLGEAWSGAAPYVAALTAPTFMLLLTSWLDRVFDARGRQPLATALQLGYDVVSIAMLYAALALDASPVVAVGCYCGVTTAYNVFWLTQAYRVAGFSLAPLAGLARLVAALFGASALACWLAGSLLPTPWGTVAAAAGAGVVATSAHRFTQARKNVMSLNRWKTFWEQQSSPLHASTDESHYAAYAQELRLLFENVAGKRVLEIGCGDGALYDHLGFSRAERYRGVDLAKSMLDEFRRKHPGVDLAQHSGHDYEDGEQYDLIFSNGVLQYFDDAMLREHLERSERMLAAGGVLVGGSIPWQAARGAYLRGGLRGGPRNTGLKYLAVRVKNLFRDSMGRWHSPHHLASLADSGGFEAQTFGSHHYPYRFHIALSPRAGAAECARRAAA